MTTTTVTGGRDYRPTRSDAWALRAALRMLGTTRVQHGGCQGVDQWAGRVAERLKIPVTIHPAKWDEHGRAAGPIRNDAMAETADSCVVFPGGRGTKQCRIAHVLRGRIVVDIHPRRGTVKG